MANQRLHGLRRPRPFTGPPILAAAATVFAAIPSQDIKREAVLNPLKPVPQVQVFQPPNLLTSTLSGAVPVAPVGKQQTTSAPQAPQQVFAVPAPRNTVLLTPALLPVGQQRTESAPPTPRILYWDRNTNTLLSTLAAAAPTPPVGAQRTESAPIQTTAVWAQNSTQIPDIPAQPIASAISEYLCPQAPAQVPLWLAPNATITLSQLVVNLQPVGKQQTDSAVQRRNLFESGLQQRNLLTSTLAVLPPLPIGEQRTDSAPIQTTAVTVFQPPTIIPPIVTAPVGAQRTDSAPFPPPAVVALQQRNLLLTTLLPLPLPVGEQRTESAPVVNPPVVATQQRNLLLSTLFVPAGALPIGHQQTDSIAQIVNPVWSQNWTIPPDLLPPTIFVPVTPDVLPAGRPRRDRYIAKYKDEEYEFATLEGLEQFVEDIRTAEKAKPKKLRAPIKIKLEPEFKDEASEYVDIPRRLEAMPTSAAMAQIRRIDHSIERILARRQADEDDDEETLLWLL